MVDRFCGRSAFRNNEGRNNDTRNSNCRRVGDSRSQCERSNCEKLLEKLRKLDFSIIDTVLYLDAYPECCQALQYYHKLIEERKKVAEALSVDCNMPVTNFDNVSRDKWSWTDSPWPWENSAN